MYVYIRSERRLWTVGFYDPDGKWHPESDHDWPQRAAARVAYLNGAALGTIGQSSKQRDRRQTLMGYAADEVSA